MKVRTRTDLEAKKRAELAKRRRLRPRVRRHVLAKRSKLAPQRVRRMARTMQANRTLPPDTVVTALVANSIATAKRERCIFSKTEVQCFYANNKSFREIMNIGDYFYFNEYLVWMVKDAFIYKDGKLALNTDVEDFEKKYCICFVKKPDSHTVSVPVYTEKGYVAHVPMAGFIVLGRFVHATEHAKATKKAKAEFADFLMMIHGSTDGEGPPPAHSFGATLSMHMEREKVTNEHMCELTEISDRTIRRHQNDEADSALSYVVALCIALHLLPCLSAIMIELAGFSLCDNKCDMAYLFLLNTEYKTGYVARCNRILMKNDLKQIVKKCSYK